MISIKVVATVASVGPYVFKTIEDGKLFFILFTVFEGKTSPQKRKVFKLFIFFSSNSDESKSLLMNDGVETQTSQEYFFNLSKYRR